MAKRNAYIPMLICVGCGPVPTPDPVGGCTVVQCFSMTVAATLLQSLEKRGKTYIGVDVGECVFFTSIVHCLNYLIEHFVIS